MRTGSTIGSLLNATFGNAVELILGIIALKEGLIRVVQGNEKKKIDKKVVLLLTLFFFCSLQPPSWDPSCQTSSWYVY